MNDYDIWNGLAVANPIVFLIGFGIVMLMGLAAERLYKDKDKK